MSFLSIKSGNPYGKTTGTLPADCRLGRAAIIERPSRRSSLALNTPMDQRGSAMNDTPRPTCLL